MVLFPDRPQDTGSLRPLLPGQTIGILGGGQLGRMLALSAARFGLRSVIYQPEGEAPAREVVSQSYVAAYDDEAALRDFAARCDVITYETENIPLQTLEFLDALLPVCPPPSALAVLQDRLLEKQTLAGLGIPLAPFHAVHSLEELHEAVALIGVPSVLKTRRFGYDGKGQVLIRDSASLPTALADIGHAPAVLEGFIPFTREISVVLARGVDGQSVAYDVSENKHRDHILWKTVVPANVRPETEAMACDLARQIGDHLALLGVFAVEFFVMDQEGRERLLVNEIAPRVHNSGHWTLEGAETSQFEQHIRAIAAWPLGSTQRTGYAVEMHNLIGEEVNLWYQLLQDADSHVHLYGKSEPRSGRKMGHVTRVLRSR